MFTFILRQCAWRLIPNICSKSDNFPQSTCYIGAVTFLDPPVLQKSKHYHKYSQIISVHLLILLAAYKPASFVVLLKSWHNRTLYSLLSTHCSFNISELGQYGASKVEVELRRGRYGRGEDPNLPQVSVSPVLMITQYSHL